MADSPERLGSGYRNSNSLHKGQLILLGKEEKWLIKFMDREYLHVAVPTPIPGNLEK